MEVYLSENAFVGLLVSTIEVYQKECFGILLGHATPQRVVVDFAVPYQTAKRKFREVHIDLGRSRRVDEAVKTASRWELVGDYHSHPMYGEVKATTKLSKVDQQFFGEGSISIVVAINDIARQQRWSYVKGGSLSGSINGYSIRITAYHKMNGQIERALLLCPYAIGFLERKVES
ncbi:MAG: Mov34/MPN/PAD-1 family protein [candidate division NC10 bacterium]|nr:Mov34/MPN/PAD-1 family protein [candidate division NC10 bacterium]